ncbi:protein unc-13 homolog [Spinacia oleracea]|uniref:Protein unc-13 homolog n=1 Tax=Spinacia oleracea TaxID=3562 RepID=A0A9R0IH60_SPIOL|nr:protein unc-13 homolog [Spinacia oleracea]
MGLQSRRDCHQQPPSHQRQGSSCSNQDFDLDLDLSWPFGKLNGVDKDDIRETSYEVFFTSCRSSPGFGGRTALAFYSHNNDHHGDTCHGNNSGPGSAARANGVGMVTNSRIKRALGLRTLKRMPSRRSSLGGAVMTTGPSSPHAYGHSHNSSIPGISFTVPSRTSRRPLTSAEIMRLQMRVTEQGDNRLRKTLMRTLVGQMGRRAETIILPLELLRHLKPSEFRDHAEYHFWQKRQLKILETGLILHPSIPLEKRNSCAIKLKEIMRANEDRPIDTSKNSETMKQLCNCVLSLAWRGANGNPTDVCHWADGHPLNLHLYIALLQSIFDHKDETGVLDEVDELMELMKKTWSTFGITRPVHNVCFTWVLFQQYVITGQTEPDLLCGTLSMLVEVDNDAKKPGDREENYVKTLASVMTSIIGWSEKKLLNYHEGICKSSAHVIMENLLPLVLQARKILDEDVSATIIARQEHGVGIETPPELAGNRVDYYIRSSVRNSFSKIAESMNIAGMQLEGEKEVSEALVNLAQGTEELAAKEKETYSNSLKRWHPVSAAIASVTLHNCYGAILQQYLSGVSMLTTEAINVLHKAGRLEKILVQMVVEDTVDCEDGGKSIVREMVPYEVDSIIIRLLRKWIEERLRKGRDCVQRAKETETWNPKSKAEPFAQSAVELMQIAKQTIDDFFEIPVGLSDDLVQDLADGLERVIREYSSFVAGCGTKQSYVPTLPPLTRCNRDSKFVKLWKRAGCSVGMQELHHYMAAIEGHHARPSTSRGTQRLYIRLNTLHYLLSHLNSLDKTLALSPRVNPNTQKRYPNSRRNLGNSTTYFELARASMQGAIQHVGEVSAYRLIFLDSNSIFYECLYVFSVSNSRIRPALRILKQNLTLLGAILIDHAQPLAVKEVMKAAFEAYLMVLLAGGCTRTFYRSDYDMIEEDFECLKRVFCTSGVGLIAEDDVDKEAEVVQGVVDLMGQPTEQLVEDFSIVACERSGMGINAAAKKLPMPPTTGRWNRSDPNTILRVLCHRNDRSANHFLKRTFQLPKRR